jgi:hypothetical protein
MTGFQIPRTRGPTIKDAPDHYDAELLLRLYDLRREPVLRESRRFLTADFWPGSAEEVVALARPDHPQNAAFRQVTGYWEMAYGMARHGIMNPDYLAEYAGEGLFIFAKLQPWLAQLREQTSPRALVNAEWLATQSEMGRTLFGAMRQRVEQRLGAGRSKA